MTICLYYSQCKVPLGLYYSLRSGTWRRYGRPSCPVCRLPGVPHGAVLTHINSPGRIYHLPRSLVARDSLSTPPCQRLLVTCWDAARGRRRVEPLGGRKHQPASAAAGPAVNSHANRIQGVVSLSLNPSLLTTHPPPILPCTPHYTSQVAP